MITLLLSLVLQVLPGLLSAPGRELISNAALTSPTISPWANTRGSVTRVTDTVKVGPGAGRHNSTGGANSYIISNMVSYTGTGEFTVSAWVFIPTATSSTSMVIHFAANGSSLGSRSYAVAKGSWTRLSYTGRTPGTQTVINILILMTSPSAGDIFYWDQTSMKRTG